MQGRPGLAHAASMDCDEIQTVEQSGREFANTGKGYQELKQQLIDALLKHDLLEQITMDITFNDGEKKSVQGFYSIAEERLYQLEGDVLGSLNKAGYLQPVFMAVASLSRMRDVIERRNRLRV